MGSFPVTVNEYNLVTITQKLAEVVMGNLLTITWLRKDITASPKIELLGIFFK